MIGGCPWVHPRGQPNTPTPPQTPFLPSGTHSTNSDTVPVARGSDGAPFFGFFYPSMTINPTLYAASARHGNSQCLVKMVLYGITVSNQVGSYFALIIDFELATFLGSLDTSSQVCKVNFSVISKKSLNN